jgi:hypothetical protein
MHRVLTDCTVVPVLPVWQRAGWLCWLWGVRCSCSAAGSRSVTLSLSVMSGNNTVSEVPGGRCPLSRAHPLTAGPLTGSVQAGDSGRPSAAVLCHSHRDSAALLMSG